MARAFTTSFLFKGELFTAVISQVNNTINIYVPDKSLHEILPCGKATYHPEQGLVIDTQKTSISQHLILNILRSIDQQQEFNLKKI